MISDNSTPPIYVTDPRKVTQLTSIHDPTTVSFLEEISAVYKGRDARIIKRSTSGLKNVKIVPQQWLKKS